MITDAELKDWSSKHGISEMLGKMYANEMRKYLMLGAKFGNNTDGFLKWLNTQKKSIK